MVARVAQFLDQEASYEQVYYLYSKSEELYGNLVSAEDWRAADESDRWYSHGLLIDPDPRFHLSPNLITCMNLRRVLATPAFKAYMSAVTGLPLGTFLPRTVHRMRLGDVVGPHNDSGQGTRLGFVMYLSPAWKADYGGALHIIGKNGVFFRIEATFNSLLVFDLTMQEAHYISDIRSTVGDRSRLTLTGLFRDP